MAGDIISHFKSHPLNLTEQAKLFIQNHRKNVTIKKCYNCCCLYIL